MEMVVLGLASLVVLYLFVNGRRNADPLNRKCAAEICELLVTHPGVTPLEIAQLFRANARYRKQARHIVSMVPPLLIQAGHPREFSLSFVPVLRQAEGMIPR